MKSISKIALAVAMTVAGGTALALPNVAILATGGTIAGSADSKTQMTGYKIGSVRVQALIDAVPDIQKIANIKGYDIANIGSESMTVEVWLKLANKINELLSSKSCDGVVITHGTDTLDETSFFLNLVVKSDKPVVMVGAMRPSTAYSADGPVNILNAVKLAASPKAKGMGVLIAMNDAINGARDVLKTNTLRVDTFQNQEMGYLGYFEAGEPVFYKKSIKPNTKDTEFNIKGLKDLPRVDIVVSHANDDGAMVEAAVKAGAKAIIHAGTGNGSIHVNTEPAINEAVKKGVIVMRAARVPFGAVTAVPGYWENTLHAGLLTPQHARILMQLALTKTSDPKKIQAIFDKY